MTDDPAARLRAWLADHRDGPDADAINAVWIEVQREQPELPGITALNIATDRLAAERATAMVRDGIPVPLALTFTGSYSRVGWLLDMAYAGHIVRGAALAMLPDIWPTSDPDDTDPRFLRAWTAAWIANRKRTLLDGPPLPPGESRKLTIYRGQGRADRPGIAWSLREDVARKFADGASLRVPGGVRDPVILTARVHRRMVMAYLTGRSEAEVIVNPFRLITAEVA